MIRKRHVLATTDGERREWTTTNESAVSVRAEVYPWGVEFSTPDRVEWIPWHRVERLEEAKA